MTVEDRAFPGLYCGHLCQATVIAEGDREQPPTTTEVPSDLDTGISWKHQKTELREAPRLMAAAGHLTSGPPAPRPYCGHLISPLRSSSRLGDSSPVTRHYPVPCPSCTGAAACPAMPWLSAGGKGPEAKGQAFRLPICLSRSAASSGVARGRTPGSLKLVRSRVPITKKNRMPPTTGMAGVIFTARYGQLPTGWEGGRGGEKEKKDNVSNRQ